MNDDKYLQEIKKEYTKLNNELTLLKNDKTTSHEIKEQLVKLQKSRIDSILDESISAKNKQSKSQTKPLQQQAKPTIQAVSMMSGYIITEPITRIDGIQSATAEKEHIGVWPLRKFGIKLTLNYLESAQSDTRQVIKLQDEPKLFKKQSSDLLYTHNDVKYNYLKYANGSNPVTFFNKYFFYKHVQDTNNGLVGGFSNHRKYHTKNIKPKTHTKRKYKSRKTLRKRKSKKT